MEKVSVIIPSYNHGRYLKESVGSVLEQTYKNVEIIVINDGSSDSTDKVAQELGDKIVYVSQNNKGLAAARNAGIKVATGTLILPLDADDMLEPTAIEKLVGGLSEGTGLVRCGYRHFGDSNDEFIFKGEVTYGSIRKANAATSASLYPRRVWEAVGGYDESMRDGYEDWEFNIRIIKAGYTVATLEEPLLLYRKHGPSLVDRSNERYDSIVEYIYEKHPIKGKILFLEDVLESGMSGVTYYRMLVPAKALEDIGYEVRFSAELLLVDENGENPQIIIDDIEWADVVVFPRYFNFSPNAVVSLMNAAKNLGKRIIYETDDCLYMIPEHNPVAKIVNQPSSQALIKFLENSADAKTITTEPLSEIVGGDNNVICPNSIDFTMWEGIENKKDDKLVIGWAGGWTHKKDLELLIPVLKRLKEKYKFEIRLFGYDPEIPKTELYYKTLPWAPVLEYPQALADASFDIGIAPLVDDEFNQFKSNIKWLEYGMLNVPIVASNLPPYQMIKDGENGFLATTPQEWYEKLEKLICDEGFRRRMGQKAHDTVVKEYDSRKTIKNWIKAYGFNE